MSESLYFLPQLSVVMENAGVQVFDSSFRNSVKYGLKPLLPTNPIVCCSHQYFFWSWTLVFHHKFSIKFKSGDWGGQTNVFTGLSSQVLVSAGTHIGALC